MYPLNFSLQNGNLIQKPDLGALSWVSLNVKQLRGYLLILG